jgi:hypothetical protein
MRFAVEDQIRHRGLTTATPPIGPWRTHFEIRDNLCDLRSREGKAGLSGRGNRQK